MLLFQNKSDEIFSCFIKLNKNISCLNFLDKVWWFLSLRGFQAIKFIQIVLTQPIQLSISIDFVYTQLNVEAVPFQTIKQSDGEVPVMLEL